MRECVSSVTQQREHKRPRMLPTNQIGHTHAHTTCTDTQPRTCVHAHAPEGDVDGDDGVAGTAATEVVAEMMVRVGVARGCTVCADVWYV